MTWNWRTEATVTHDALAEKPIILCNTYNTSIIHIYYTYNTRIIHENTFE